MGYAPGDGFALGAGRSELASKIHQQPGTRVAHRRDLDRAPECRATIAALRAMVAILNLPGEASVGRAARP